MYFLKLGTKLACFKTTQQAINGLISFYNVFSQTDEKLVDIIVASSSDKCLTVSNISRFYRLCGEIFFGRHLYYYVFRQG